MVFGSGRSPDPQAPAPARGWSLSKTILPEGGVLAMVLDGALAIADDLGNRAVSFVNNVVDGAMGAAGHVFGKVTDVSFGSSISRAHEPAVAQAIVRESPVQRLVLSPYECDMNDVCCPVTPINASSGPSWFR